MKRIEKMCNDIIKMQEKRPNSEYKKEILKAVKRSKKTGYKISPYELMWITNYLGVKL